ncbi:MAG TPA: hypothetical protein VFM54_11845 [Micromonosporaceae bacterium]|nr:hypothetical protein [Micromonosporaceae bacterium]
MTSDAPESARKRMVVAQVGTEPVEKVLRESGMTPTEGGAGVCDGHVAVGEMITMVAEEGRLAAVPASCLVAARAAATGDFGVQQLSRLTSASAVAVLPLMPDEALEVGRLARARPQHLTRLQQPVR